MFSLDPLLILIIGISTVVSMIVLLRINAFLALIIASTVVSLLAPGELSVKISRIAEAFGSIAGTIGIVIALAAIIGRCLIESGAADRIVRLLVRLFGEKRSDISLMSSGFILSMPVFFDTVFYLLLPLARSMHRRTKKNYLLLVLAMATGASITHSLVPPTPGPLILADILSIDLGIMIGIGLLTGIPTAITIMFFIKFLSKRMDIPMRTIGGDRPEPEPLPDDQLPGLFISILPIFLPLLLITTNTIISTLARDAQIGSIIKHLAAVFAVLGDANLAMLISAGIALVILYRYRKPGREDMANLVENTLMTAGLIILIVSAGGAFGEMLKIAQVGNAIQDIFASGPDQQLSGMALLVLSFFIAFLIRFAQGSTTVAMITTAAMFATLLPEAKIIGFHPVYIAAAIGFGAQCGLWMNDSGFWIFAKMGGFTEVETLKTWSVTVSVMAVIGLLFTALFANILPLV